MTNAPGNAIAARKRLGRILRQLRGTRTLTEVAVPLGWSIPKLSRLETEQDLLPQRRKVEALLDHYGVTGDYRDTILGLVDEIRSRQPRWWDNCADVVGESRVTLIGLEDAAVKLRVYEPASIPPLLQTETYARAFLTARDPNLPTGTITRIVGARMRRQDRIWTDQHPVDIEVVLSEASLRTRVGDGDVMADQMRHLLKAARLSNVHVMVLPFTSGSPAAGPFTMITLPESDPETVHIETPVSDLWIEERDRVVQFRARWERLLAHAAERDAGLALIADLEAGYRSG